MQTFRVVKYLTSAAVMLTLLAPAPTAAAATRADAAQDAVAASATEAAPPAAEDWQPPLSTRGRYIVDAQGRRFRLKSANWDGAQGSWSGSGSAADPANHHAYQNSSGIPLGLDRAPLSELLADFHRLGINSIRLPFSNEMIRTTTPVPDTAVAANPRLRGSTPCRSSTPSWPP